MSHGYIVSVWTLGGDEACIKIFYFHYKENDNVRIFIDQIYQTYPFVKNLVYDIETFCQSSKSEEITKAKVVGIC